MICRYSFIVLTADSGEPFVKCILPILLSATLTLAVTALVIAMIPRCVSTTFFIVGAVGGAFGMFLLHDGLLSANRSFGKARVPLSRTP